MHIMLRYSNPSISALSNKMSISTFLPIFPTNDIESAQYCQFDRISTKSIGNKEWSTTGVSLKNWWS